MRADSVNFTARVAARAIVGDVDEMRDRSGWLEFSRPALELRFL